jgi:signal transduction histidine kinase/Tfp pilus assembly protein PilF
MIKKFKNIIIILFAGCFILNSAKVFSQNEEKVDSLNLQFKQANSDTVKIKLLIAAGDMFKNTNPDTALYYYKLALFIADHIKNNMYEIQSYKGVGNVFLNQGANDKAMVYFTKALNIALELGDKKEIAGVNNNIGSSYYKQGEYDKATEYYLKSLKLWEELGNKKEMAGLYNNIGMVQTGLGAYDKALEYYSLSLKIAKEINDKKVMILIYNGIGNDYYQKFKYDKAIENYLQSLKYSEDLENIKGISRSYMNIGNVYYSQGTIATNNVLSSDYFNKSMKYYMKSLNMADKLGDNNYTAIVLVNIAMINVDMKNYMQAIEYANKSLNMALETGALETQRLAYGFLSAAFDSLRDYKSAFKYQKLYQQIKDSIFNDESNARIADLQTKYETGKKETEITKLTNEKDLQALKLKQNRILIYSISLGAILLIAVILALFNVYKQKQTRRKMFSKIIEIEEKERKRFAEDLHDGLGPLLSSVNLYVNELKSDRHTRDKKDEFMQYTSELITEAIKNTKSIANNLMPGVLNDYGLVTAIETFSSKLKKSGSINISVLSDKQDQRYHPALEITLYRVILEMINNTIKHAHATNIAIDINDNDKILSVKYEDDGDGFDLENTLRDPKKGMGLGNIRNRVKSIGGNCVLESQEGKGMRCLIDINYKKYDI